jgi:hypothetical protein
MLVPVSSGVAQSPHAVRCLSLCAPSWHDAMIPDSSQEDGNGIFFKAFRRRPRWHSGNAGSVETGYGH